MIKEVLAQSNLSFKECKGNVKTREKVLRNFRIGNVPILFLNAQYNGAGINLQETTDIILYHEMSETVRMQIVGRANRLGRVGELHVHTLTS
jgi:SNF2 family DNA or RNA helicase